MVAHEGGFMPADQIDSFLAPVPAFAMRHVVGIAFGNPGQRPRAVASATAVEIAGGRFLATAKHVVESEAARRDPWRLFIPRRNPRRNIPDRVVATPTIVQIDSSDVVWRSAENDVAILRAPADLGVDFFSGRAGAELTTRVRRSWDRLASRDAYFAAVITGFPSFARDSAGLGVYGLISLAASLVGASRTDDRVGAASRFALNIGCTTVREEYLSEPQGPLFARQLEDPTSEPLAGLSGGPMVIVTNEARFLGGILYEGRRPLESGFAVPWDSVHAEFLESLSIRP